jgi:hypothetical protein
VRVIAYCNINYHELSTLELNVTAKRILKEVDVTFISLVSKGANKKAILWKSANSPETPSHSKTISLSKIDDDKRIVYGIVYSPDEVDSQGDTATAEVIEKMSYSFMRNLRLTKVDAQHDEKADEGFVCESWLIKSGDPVFPMEKAGAWAVAIKVENEETWKLVKSGEIGGLSLAGDAKVEEVKKADTEDEAPAGVILWLRKKLGLEKDFDSEAERSELYNKSNILITAIFNALGDEKVVDKRSAVEEIVKQFVDSLKSERSPGRTSGSSSRHSKKSKTSSRKSRTTQQPKHKKRTS